MVDKDANVLKRVFVPLLHMHLHLQNHPHHRYRSSAPLYQFEMMRSNDVLNFAYVSQASGLFVN